MTDAPHTLVMTGGTSGIGRAAVTEMLRRDPHLRLILLARAESPRGDLARDKRVTFVTADMERAADVRAAAAAVRQMLAVGAVPPLRGIAANAGVSPSSAAQVTADGLERTFAVNVLAPHILISELAPVIGTPGRLVVTVSDTHIGDFRHNMGGPPPPCWTDPAVLAKPGAFARPTTMKAGLAAYTTSKLAAIYLVHEWARRLPTGLDIVAHNPGLVPGTGLPRQVPAPARFLMNVLMKPLIWTPLADTIEGAGRKLADVIAGRTPAPTGSYVDRTRPARSSAESYDEDRERDLWDFLSTL